MATKPTAKPPAAGRPPGAKTQDREVITKTSTQTPCPKCNETAPPKGKRFLRNLTALGLTQYNARCGACDHPIVFNEKTE